MREGADVGTHGDGNSGGELLLELLRVVGDELLLERGHAGRDGMLGEIFGDGESGDGEDLFFAHQAHGFFAELIGVVDGFDAGAGGVTGAGFTGGVDGDFFANAGGFMNRCG